VTIQIRAPWNLQHCSGSGASRQRPQHLWHLRKEPARCVRAIPHPLRQLHPGGPWPQLRRADGQVGIANPCGDCGGQGVQAKVPQKLRINDSRPASIPARRLRSAVKATLASGVPPLAISGTSNLSVQAHDQAAPEAIPHPLRRGGELFSRPSSATKIEVDHQGGSGF